MERTEKGDKEVMEKRPESDLTREEANMFDVDKVKVRQCEINLKKAEEQLGMEIYLDKDQKAKADYGKEEEVTQELECNLFADIHFYGDQYQKLAMRTNDGKASIRLACAGREASIENIDFGGVIAACMGLSGEVGELNDLMKKFIFHEKEFDETHLKKELGDVCWYIALMCESFGWNLDDILQMNIEKLKKRYPDGFDVDRANHRKEGDI